MPIFATKEARAFWESQNNRSRSLAASRFSPLKGASTGDDEKFRKLYAEQLKQGSIHRELLELRSSLNSLLTDEGGRHIFAKLEARLILNTAGGVIENGGICLDRNSGIPYIPGSAIKGAARRHAVWSLSQETDPDQKAQLLTEISLIFGYGNQEWKSGRKLAQSHPHGGPAKSDFWLAMAPLENPGPKTDPLRNENWERVSTMAKAKITKILNRAQFPNQLGGCISFLPAFPENDPGIDLDILTSHHPDYYKGEQEIATDNESPVPLVFPAIPTGTAFQFPLLKCRRSATSELEDLAEEHLRHAIEMFGLGAKTNAGYGWFSVDFAAQKRADQKRTEVLEEKKRTEHRAKLSEDELIAEDLKALGPEDFASAIGNLENEEPEKQRIACQMLLTSEKEQWKKWRRQKKGKWTERVPKIREIAKQHNIDLT